MARALAADGTTLILALSRFLAGRLALARDRPDAAQEAALAMLAALPGYDPAAGVPLPRYLALCGRRQVGKYLARERNRGIRRAPRGVTVSFDFGVDHAPAPEPREAPPPPPLACLPRRERAVITRLFLRGEPHRRVAADLGVGKTRLFQLRARALGRLRAEAG